MLKEHCQAIEDAEVRLKRLTDLISETVKSWTMAPVVEVQARSWDRPKVAQQIETPRSPDPIMRRPGADREEKR
uniref:hypothetical protein n=1 Tax=Mesorhizobium caraganae TaxID=483206 RepID=UPI001FE24A0A|nr:hypothetical protein [Mesorhizobium caraganae]